ncbi:MAG: FAD-dependent oxidoreductase [Nitrospiraceae bacterium]|nr:FAD-dependent oxidoreductase [Nitrospiraceae bacterium]
MKKVVIIGGGAAGTLVALYLRKINKEDEITILEKTNNTLYSPCALPFVISKDFKNIDDITVFDKSFYFQNNINLVNECEVNSIDKNNKKIQTTKGEYEYDFLVLATGSRTFVPPIPGIENSEYYVLKTKQDVIKIEEKLKKLSKKSKIAVIGGGLIGVETAHSMLKRGFDVSVIEVKDRILNTIFDKPVVNFISEYLKEKKLKIYQGAKIKNINKNKVELENESIDYDMLLISTGVRANIDLAKSINLPTEKGILVDESMRCDYNIFAIGDSVEPFGFIDHSRTMSQLGTTAAHEAKIVADNINKLIHGDINLKKLNNVLNSAVAKIGELKVGATGYTEEYAKIKGIRTYSGMYIGKEAADYYPSEDKIIVKIVSDETGKIIGGQIAAKHEVLGRVDLISLAIQKQLHISDLIEADFAYTPPLVDINDPLTTAASMCLKRIEG